MAHQKHAVKHQVVSNHWNFLLHNHSFELSPEIGKQRDLLVLLGEAWVILEVDVIVVREFLLRELQVSLRANLKFHAMKGSLELGEQI